MSAGDILRLTWGTLAAHRLRSLLTMLGIIIGIASVMLLTSIGEGLRVYIISEFTQFGTNLLAVRPGHTKTTGAPGAFGGTIHHLTLDDARSLERIAGVERIVPTAFGSARVEWQNVGRSVFIYGVTSDVPRIWKFGVRQGRFLPAGDVARSTPVAVLGPALKREIFGDRNALGEYVRIGGRRFMVIGVMAPKGHFLGFDIDDAAYIPVASALTLFNRPELMEIDVLFSSYTSGTAVSDRIRHALIQRHSGDEDFTVETQAGMLETLDKVIRIISFAVGAIGGISLLVGAIGILTMMWISVHERTTEIGLAKALGATANQILMLYLVESAVLSTFGGILGLLTGYACGELLHFFVPKLPLSTPVGFVLLALAVSLFVGIASGVMPARRAAKLDPIQALAAE